MNKLARNALILYSVVASMYNSAIKADTIKAQLESKPVPVVDTRPVSKGLFSGFSLEDVKVSNELELVVKSDTFSDGPREGKESLSSKLSWTPRIALSKDLSIFTTYSIRNQRGDAYYTNEKWTGTARVSLDRVWVNYKLGDSGAWVVAGVYPTQFKADTFFDRDLSKAGAVAGYTIDSFLGFDKVTFMLEQTFAESLHDLPSANQTSFEVNASKKVGAIVVDGSLNYSLVHSVDNPLASTHDNAEKGFLGSKMGVTIPIENSGIRSVNLSGVYHHGKNRGYSYSPCVVASMFDGVLAVRYSYPVRVGEHALGATGAGTYADDMFLNGKGPAYGLEINLAKMLNIKPGNIKSMTLSCDRYNPTSPSGDETIRDRFMFVTTLGF